MQIYNSDKFKVNDFKNDCVQEVNKFKFTELILT